MEGGKIYLKGLGKLVRRTQEFPAAELRPGKNKAVVGAQAALRLVAGGVWHLTLQSGAG